MAITDTSSIDYLYREVSVGFYSQSWLDLATALSTDKSRLSLAMAISPASLYFISSSLALALAVSERTVLWSYCRLAFCLAVTAHLTRFAFGRLYVTCTTGLDHTWILFMSKGKSSKKVWIWQVPLNHWYVPIKNESVCMSGSWMRPSVFKSQHFRALYLNQAHSLVGGMHKFPSKKKFCIKTAIKTPLYLLFHWKRNFFLSDDTAVAIKYIYSIHLTDSIKWRRKAASAIRPSSFDFDNLLLLSEPFVNV